MQELKVHYNFLNMHENISNSGVKQGSEKSFGNYIFNICGMKKSLFQDILWMY